MFLVLSMKNVHVSDVSEFPQFLLIQELEEEWTILVWPRILKEHKNPKKMRRFFFIFHISYLYSGAGRRVDNIGRGTSTALKETRRRHILCNYVMYVYMCADQSRWICSITDACTLYATHFGSVTFSS